MKMREVGAPLVGALGGHKGRPYAGYFQSSKEPLRVFVKRQSPACNSG